MIRVYHLTNSRSQRIIWLLEELELEYELIFCSRDPQTGNADKSLEKIHPLCKAPILSIIEKAVNQRYIKPTLLAELDFIEQHLSEHRWFAGDEFSAADVLLTFLLEAVCVSIATKDRQPQISAYVDNVRTRPAYQRAMQRGQWSKTAHEQCWK